MSQVLVAVLVLFVAAVSADAQSTAFTYQGHLSESGSPATGNYDFLFRLFAVPSGGVPVGGASGTNNVPVSNGLFTVTVDVGPSPFDGADRWLDIGVRTNGAGFFTSLAARQKITATPYAIRAFSAGNVPNGSITASKLAPGAVSFLGASDGSPTNAVVVDPTGFVGIGANDPHAALDISATAPILSARRVFQVQDEMNGYTNLDGAFGVAAFSNLLAVCAFSDSGVTILDVSNPASPIRRSQFRNGDGSFTNLNSAHGVAMKANLLAVAGYSANTVTLVSVSNPASPVRLVELRDGIGGWNELAGAWAVAISGNLLAIGSDADWAVTLADISNPVAPIKRVEMKDGVFGFTNLAGVRSLAISGNLLAIGAYTDRAVTLVDIADPSNPVKLAELRDGVGGYDGLSGIYSVALSGNLLAIAAYTDSALTLVNVANPASPVKLAELRQGVAGVDWLNGAISVGFSGNWLAVGANLSGTVTVLDVTDPANLHPLVIRDNNAGFSYLGNPLSVAFAGQALAIASENALTLAIFPLAEASLVSKGWVGIGTDSPVAPLNVVGDVVVRNSQLFDINADRIELGLSCEAIGNNSVAMGNDTSATGAYSTALGYQTTAAGDFATAMGNGSVAKGNVSVACGNVATASGTYATALGNNTVASGYASVAMGNSTIASGDYSTASGDDTSATGDHSIAIGFRGQATNHGAFVWTDSNLSVLTSTNNNSVTMRASGGYRLFSNPAASAGVFLASNGVAWAALSDRDAKKNFQVLNGRQILDKLAAVPIQRWNYKWESDNDVPHIGPVAQDFKAAFYPGRDQTHITTLEFDGVALAAIQGLNQKVEEQRSELKRRDADIQRLQRQNQRLEDRLQKLEALLTKDR